MYVYPYADDVGEYEAKRGVWGLCSVRKVEREKVLAADEKRAARATAKVRKVRIDDDDKQVTETVEVVFMHRDMRALW